MIPLLADFNRVGLGKSIEGSNMYKILHFRWIQSFAALISFSFSILSMPPALAQSSASSNSQNAPPQIHALKVTLLSTMLVGNITGVGEWGFAALIEADGHRILLDTGNRPDTVLQNARDLKIDLSNVREVILTHNHWDHVGGLMTLHQEMMKTNPSALSVVHVARGVFYSRPSPQGEGNPMVAIKKKYEATGGTFIEREEGADLFSGAWVTGPVRRKYPERN